MTYGEYEETLFSCLREKPLSNKAPEKCSASEEGRAVPCRKGNTSKFPKSTTEESYRFSKALGAEGGAKYHYRNITDVSIRTKDQGLSECWRTLISGGREGRRS